MAMPITTTAIQSIVLDAAIVYIDYGEQTTQRRIGLTKGGVEFNVTENVRDIEFDGRRGKTKGMTVVDEVNAYVKFSTLEITNANMLLALGAATEATSVINSTTGGVVNSTLKNITIFGTNNATSSYKKITLYNPAGAGGFTMATTDKGEATIELTLSAHWDPTDYTDPLYTIQDTTTAPT